MKRNMWFINNVIIDIDEVVAFYKDNYDITHFYLKNGIEIKTTNVDFNELLEMYKLYNTNKVELIPTMEINNE